MGYYSELAIELLEGRCDRELFDLDDIIEVNEDEPTNNHDLTIEQQEAQYSIWNESYRQQLEQLTVQREKSQNQAKVYKKNKRQ